MGEADSKTGRQRVKKKRDSISISSGRLVRKHSSKAQQLLTAPERTVGFLLHGDSALSKIALISGSSLPMSLFKALPMQFPPPCLLPAIPPVLPDPPWPSTLHPLAYHAIPRSRMLSRTHCPFFPELLVILQSPSLQTQGFLPSMLLFL